MKKQSAGVLASVLVTLSQSLPVLSQVAQKPGYYPAPELKGIPGLIYDPPPDAVGVPTLNSASGASVPGIINSPNPGESRAWPAGAGVTSVVKFRDLDPKVNPQFAGFTKLSLRDFNRNVGTDIGGVPLKDIDLVNGLNLKQVKGIYNNGNVKIKDSLPIVQAALGVVFDPRGAQKQIKNNALSFGKKALIKRLSKEKALKDVPYAALLNGDWRGAITEGEQVLLREIANDIPEHLHRLPVGALTISVIEGDFSKARQQAQNYAVNEIFELTLDEALEKFPELQQIPLGSIAQIANQPLDQSLPQIADLALENIPGLEEKFLSAVPGLGDSPIGAALGDVIGAVLAGTLFAKFGIAHSGMDGPEEFIGRPLSGGTPNNKFKVIPGIKSTDSKTKKPKRGFPRWEMKPAVKGGLIGGEKILGKEWMDVAQQVPGCKGIMCIFGKWEPAGIKPIKSLPVKFGIGDTTEYANKPSTSRIHVNFQVCIVVFFEKQCSAHIFGYKTPWKVTNGSLFPIVARNRIQDYFPGVDTNGLTVDFNQCPTFLASSSGAVATAGSSPPKPQNEAEAFANFKKASADAGIQIDRDSQGRLLLDQRNAASTVAWVEQEAGTYGLQVQKNKGSITFNYTGKLHDSPANSGTTSNKGFSGIYQASANNGSTLAPKLQGIPGQPGSVAPSPSAPKSQSKVASSSWGSPVDVHNLIMTSVLESTGIQNQTDVAVAIMNRVISPKHPGTITDVVFQPHQYQPNFGRSPVTTKEEAIARIAQKTKSVQSAIAQYEALEDRLNDPNAIAASQVFLGGAIDFRGQSLLYNRKSGDPYRGNVGANYYFQESQDPQIAAAVLGTLGVESSAVDAANIAAAAGSQGVANCSPSNGPGQSNIDNSNFVQGSGVSSGRLSDPLGKYNYKLTSNFGPRTRPRVGFHSGVDLAHYEGTPFVAADGGVVVASRWNGDYGNWILIDHGNGFATWYGHNKINYVKAGDTVDPGQPIGEVGSTGFSTGPHIDFGVVEGYITGDIHSGRNVNPRKHVNLPPVRTFNTPQ